jgi:hypothetical protein
MKIFAAILRKFTKGPLELEDPKIPRISLLERVESSTDTSGMSSSDSPWVRKSAGDRNSLLSTGLVVNRAGLLRVKGVVSMISDGTSTEIVTLTAAA